MAFPGIPAKLSTDEIACASAVTGISANLPGEIITDILTRLPVKPLTRFKCVSKSFYILLTGRNFIKKHLHHSFQNDLPCLLLKQNFKLFFADQNESNEAKRLELSSSMNSLEKIELSGSCAGLICISDHIRNEDIFLLNPSIGYHKKIPLVEFDVPTIETTCFTALGFGYFPAEDDYKVVRMVYLYDKPFVNIDSYQCEARIYSLRTNSWEKIGEVPFHISSRSSLSLGNGKLIWTASRGFGLTMVVLVVSFDMGKKVFDEIPQPDFDGEGNNSHIALGVFNGCLSIFHQWRDSERVEVWLMKEFGVKESWSKLFVIELPAIGGDECFRYLRPVWVLKSGEILMQKSEMVMVLYDPEKKKFKNVGIRRCPRRFDAVLAHIGSLVDPNNWGDENGGARMRELEKKEAQEVSTESG